MTDNTDTDELRITRLVGISNKKKLFERLSEILSSVSEDLSFEKVLDSLTSRERMGSTYIGDGVAIPHCKLDIDKPYGTIIQLDNPVDYNNKDDQVSVVFGLLIPQDQCNEHLPLLSNVATICKEGNCLKRIKSATTQSQLVDIICSTEINLKPYKNETSHT